jgi:hypothetical protein
MQLEPDGTLNVKGATGAASKIATGGWHAFTIDLDTAAKNFSVSLDGKSLGGPVAFAAAGDAPERIEFRTGDYRMEDDIAKAQGLSDNVPGWDEPGADEPVEPAAYYIREFRTTIP